MKDVECPYCGEELKIDHDDGQGYDEDVLHEQECSNCEKAFVYTTYIMISYNSYKADCLNGEEHRYKPTMTVPRRYTKMRCEDCGEERQPTEKEMKSIMKEKE